MGDVMQGIKNQKNLIWIFGYTCLTLAVFIFAFLLLAFPECAGEGIKEGIELCLYTLIPSMFPFMFLSYFVVSSGIVQKSEKLFSFVTEKLFAFPGVCGSVILLSMTGGFPVGGRMVSEIYDRGLINKSQGQRLMLFCVNPGPAFVITGVGYYMLGSKKAGLLIYISVVMSSLVLGFLSRFVFDDGYAGYASKNKTAEQNIYESVISSVSQSSKGMFNVCAWVLIFSCITSLLDIIPLSESIKGFLTSVAEVTNGCKYASENLPVPVLAAVIGFSGLCAQMQILPTVIKLKMPLKNFFTARIVNAAFSFLISMLLFELFPVAIKTVSLGSMPQKVNSDWSLSVSIGLMFMCALLLLGENYRIKKINKNMFFSTIKK